MFGFVLLNAYRICCRIIAIFVLIVAIVAFVQGLNAFSYDGFDRLLGAFLTALPFLGLALTIGVFAELLTLFMSINEHLDNMKQVQMRTYAVLAEMSSQRAQTAVATSLPGPGTPNRVPEIGGPMDVRDSENDAIVGEVKGPPG